MNFDDPHTWKIWLLLTVCGCCLMALSRFAHSSVQASPHRQSTITCPPAPATPDLSLCPSTNPDPIWDRQPFPTEIAPAFREAGLNRLGSDGPVLTPIIQGIGDQQKRVSPYVPCILLASIGYIESFGWRHFNTSFGECGFTKVGVDPTPTPFANKTTCGYGIMQITSGMSNPDNNEFVPARVAASYRYNIGTGAKLLIEKWNGLLFYVGENDPYIVEDWYYAVWAYNSFDWANNPNNPGYNDSRGETWLCGADPGQSRSDFPYQELVWGCAANPPGDDYWSAVSLSLPIDDDVYNGVNQPPPSQISRPQSYHYSCMANYLPNILKSEIQPPPTPSSGCKIGRVLLEDTFEDGDPFREPGTGSTGPWEQAALDNFPNSPSKTSIDHLNDPIPRPSDDDGIKFGGEDNQKPDEEAPNDIDQAIYNTIPIYPDTEEIKIKFDLFMESDELVEIEGSYDHLYWGTATNIDPFNLQLDSYYECNEDNCGPDGQESDVRWNRYWFTVERFVKIKREWEENGGVFIGFWVNVNRPRQTNFYLDNVKIEITECQ